MGLVNRALGPLDPGGALYSYPWAHGGVILEPMVLIRLSLLAVAAAAISLAQPFPDLIGAGISDGLEGSRLKMFVDVAKGHRPMRQLGTEDLAPVDENGWPTTDASTVLFDIRPVPAWAPPIDDPDAFQPDWSGVYKMSFHGQADLQGYDASTIHLENLIYDPDTNTTRLDLVVDPGTGLLYMEFANTRRNPDSDLGTGITDLRLLRPGYAEDTEQVFTEQFLAALQPFRVIRFMGFLMTNSTNPEYSAEKNKVEWADRRLPTDATQQQTPARAAGVAWEYAIDICNLTGKDMWLNIPIAASDDYILQLALLLQQNLNPDSRIYIEISNEVWNPLFTQYRYNREAAADEVLNQGEPYLNHPTVTGANPENTWALRRQLRRLYDTIQIFAGVFGSDQINNRIRGVYAWWTINPTQYYGALAWFQMNLGEPKDYIWAIAKTNYYNDEKARADEDPASVVEVMRNDSDAGRYYTRRLNLLAADFGLKLVAYEAGPDNGGGSTDNIGNRIRANRIPEMGDLLRYDFIDSWFNLGGDLYMYLEVAGAYSRWGCWGQTEDVSDLNSVKMRAIWDLAVPPPPPPPDPEPAPPPEGGSAYRRARAKT
jgi:hypothetical protein